MYRMCPYHKINVNNPVMKPTFISSTSWPSALFCLEIPFIQFKVFPSFACSISPNQRFQSVLLFVYSFSKKWVGRAMGSLRRRHSKPSACIDGLYKWFRQCVGRLQRGASDGKRNRFSGDCLTSTMLTWTDSDCYSCNEGISHCYFLLSVIITDIANTLVNSDE